ncbi:MAG: alpha/beta hydrolase, partial [Pseudomonadota bacterium]
KEEPSAGVVASHVGETRDDNAVLERHNTRVQRLIQQSVEASQPGASRYHAVIEVGARAEQVSGNLAAERLLECRFPCRLADLPLDPEALRFIRAFKAAPAAQRQQEEVFLATVETGEVRSCMALIQRPDDLNGVARISMSYIDWSDRLLARLGGAFGLSARETRVLEGYLRQKSQSQIADDLERSLDTIKTQSKTILRKTGCARISDVVQLAAGIAYLLREMPEAEPDRSVKLPWTTPKIGMQTLVRPGGRQLAWYRVGEGTRPVLFVHGLVQGPFFPPAVARELRRLDLTLICPSRPGFGYTDPSASRASYNDTCVADAIALLEHLKPGLCPVLIHQGGSSHGFRIANAMGEVCSGLVVADGGVPVHTDDALPYIDTNSRTLAVAAKRSPSLLKMLVDLGITTYKLRGVDAFLHKLYSYSESDKLSFKNPAAYRALADGAFHVSEQSSEVWVRDGRAAMANWEADLDAYRGRQYWVLGDDAQILNHRWIEQRLAGVAGVDITVLEDAGNTLLSTHHTVVLDRVVALLEA